MKKNIIVILAIITGFLVSTGFTPGRFSADAGVPYPEGYRMWTHVKTGLIGPSSPSFQVSGGYHHIYANAKAMQGYTSGYFPEGSVLVFDVIEAKEQNGNTLEGERRHSDVMVKDSLQYAGTGGWGYEEFGGDSHTERILTATVRTQCVACHAKKDDKVFSEFRK
ncbi:MAG: cytochrome [Sediminibacterium sp.]|nr:cytochrome [Sediminibacterium sp.]